MFLFVFLIIIIIIIVVVIVVVKKYSNKYYNIPRVIYTYWDRIEENEVIQAILGTWPRRCSAEWKIEVISKNNVANYVEAGVLEKWKEALANDPVRFSDFLRVYLLNRNGGVWMDAGILLIDGGFLERYRQEMIQQKTDILLYEFKVFSTPNQLYLENWFFMCPQHSRFMKDLYHEFTRACTIGFLQYKNEVLAPHVSFQYIRLQGEDTYHIQHGIINYLMKSGYPSKNMIIKDAQESMFKAHDVVGWNNEELIRYIIKNKDWSRYYAIKLTGANREPIGARKQEFITAFSSNETSRSQSQGGRS